MAKIGDEVKSVLIDTNTFDDYALTVVKHTAHSVAQSDTGLENALEIGHEIAYALSLLRALIFEGEE